MFGSHGSLFSSGYPIGRAAWKLPSTLLWFRRDLRLHDLPSLVEAAADGAEVLGCFVLDPRLEKSSGPRRLQFLGDSLRELSDALGGRLLITRGRPEQRIPLLCEEIGATSSSCLGRLQSVRGAARRGRDCRAGRRGLGTAGHRIAVSRLTGPCHQGRRDPVQGVHAVPGKVARDGLALPPAPSATTAVSWIDPAEWVSKFRVDAPDPGAD